MDISDESWDDRFARFRKRLAAQHYPPYRNEVPFKVPAYLKEVKPSQFTPHTVSLGLNSRLEPGIEYIKAEFQGCFLKWKSDSLGMGTKQTTSPNNQRSGRNFADSGEFGATGVYTWDQFIDDLKLDTDVKTANRWYSIDASPVRPIILKSFLAVDALFLTLFLRYSCQTDFHLRLPEEVYAELEKQTVYRLLAEARSGIWRDVFLLENQIPLHIIAKVWKLMPDMVCRTEEKAFTLFNRLLREVVKDRYLELFESSSKKGEEFVSDMLSDKHFLDCDHLLDCLHYAVCYSPPPKDDKSFHLRTADEKGTSPANTIPSATQLKKVGIRLNSDGCNFIYQVKFENSFWRGPVLLLPRLFISDQTESLLRNLAVFEMVSFYQSPRPGVGPRLSTITSFLILLDKLIEHKADVQLLRGDGIITSSLGNNNEVCEMWSTLCKRFSAYQHTEWVEMLKKVNSRYKNRRYQLMAEFQDKYFARPWVVVSWVAGTLLLVLTGLQTLFTIIPYYSPPPAPH